LMGDDWQEPELRFGRVRETRQGRSIVLSLSLSEKFCS
jgi:hypothetical protein